MENIFSGEIIEVINIRNLLKNENIEVFQSMNICQVSRHGQ